MTTQRARKRFAFKVKVFLKWRDSYTENISMVTLMAGLKIEGTVKWRGLKSQGPLYRELTLDRHLLSVDNVKYLWGRFLHLSDWLLIPSCLNNWGQDVHISWNRLLYSTI